ncbi:cytochrome P450 [Mycena capillaripes]|nr:cytochrome P450 [Mycena capillaripes]
MKLDTLSQPLTLPGKVKLGPKGSIPIDGITEFDEFTTAFEHVAVVTTQRGAQGELWPLMELFKDKTEDSIATIMNWMEPIVKRTIDEKQRRQETGVETAAGENFLLDFLASKTDDVEHIRYELITYLIASRDTTASLLTFLLYFLSMHSAVLERLRTEILSVLGPEESPTHETLRTKKYHMRFLSLLFLLRLYLLDVTVRAVLNEVLRLFPSAPLSSRMSLDIPLVVPASSQQAFYFPPKTQIRMISLLLHRRHDLWGDNADEFRPERWLETTTREKVQTTPFMYCPFWGGPRTCIGQEFALNEAGFFVVKLLQRFKSFRFEPDFQPVGSLPPKEWLGKRGRQGMEKIFPAISMTLHSKGGLWISGVLDGS